jgi:hypothetical protein
VNSRLTLEVVWDVPLRGAHAGHRSGSSPSDDDDAELSPSIDIINRGTASGWACACASSSLSAAQR